MPATKASARKTAAERREEVIVAGTAEFAAKGFYGSSTEVIARKAGISHPYLFRLFGSKVKLFIAGVEHGVDRVCEAFEQGVSGSTPGERLLSLAAVWGQLQQDRVLVMDQIQLYAAACGEPEIRAVAREQTFRLRALATELSGASPEQVRSFFAQGALFNIATALEIPELAASDLWARGMLEADG